MSSESFTRPGETAHQALQRQLKYWLWVNMGTYVTRDRDEHDERTGLFWWNSAILFNVACHGDAETVCLDIGECNEPGSETYFVKSMAEVEVILKKYRSNL